MNTLNVDMEITKITAFLKSTFAREGFTSAVLGVSGGIDSAVSLALTVAALGKENVYPILLPYGPLNMQGVLDAMERIQQVAIPFNHIVRIDIKPSVDTLLKGEFGADKIRRGNVMARVRMICLFDQAKKRNALVVGTENKTEHMLGYFTRYGDEASDVEPLRHIYKTEVYALAKALNIPKTIIEKPPSADLWPEQTDEKEFGFSYQEADEVLSLLHDKHMSIDKIKKTGLDAQTVDAIVARMNRFSFKHKTPYSIE